MGAGGSALSELSHDQLLAYAAQQQVPSALIEALTSNEVIDGQMIQQALQALPQANTHSTSGGGVDKPPPVMVPADKAGTVSFELDLHGQPLVWYIRWALENEIPGYQYFMLKRSWCWYQSWEALQPEGWSFDQIQRAVINNHFEGGYEQSCDVDAIRTWLQTNERPGEGEAFRPPETTASVATRVIHPKTAVSKLTYRQAFLQPDESKKATHFVSHSWSYPFWGVLEALISHQLGFHRKWIFEVSLNAIVEALEALPSDEVNYYWFDLFNKNQHIVTSDTTSIELAEAIRQPGKMVFVLHPSMQWAIKRIWCLYEVLVCMQVGAELQVAFSFEMLDMFERQQLNDINMKKRIRWNSLARYRQLPSVDVSNADATVHSDKAMILAKIKETVGIAEMNQLVKDKLNACFQESAQVIENEDWKPTSNNIVENNADDFIVLLDDRDSI